MQLAPIGLSVYTRLSHIKKTIEALSLNTLAKESDLFIFSDAPRPGDESKVKFVRSFLKTVTGFKSVTIIKRQQNDQAANNLGGIELLLDDYGKCIFVEEDIVTAPGFLSFINGALDFYEENQAIMSICGYSPPLDISCKDDIFILPRFCSWGFGITKDQYDRIKKIPKSDLKKIDQNRMSQFGDDIYSMVCKEANGEIEAFDVRAMYAQYKEGNYTVYPQQSLVQNIGHDGTGIHCKDKNKFYHENLWLKQADFKFIAKPALDLNIVAANARFRHKKKKFTKKFKRKIGYYYLREQLGKFARKLMAKNIK